MEITTVSRRGATFVRLHEGNPRTAYLDPTGTPTLGPGFTMASPYCRAELAKIGITKIVPGKTTIANDDAERILKVVLDTGYGREVVANSPADRTQYQMDAAASAAYNLGGRVVSKWTFGKLWRAGKIKQAADHLGSHYNTSKGKRLPGLVRRRKEEALMFEKGIYTGVDTVAAAPEGVAREASETAPETGDPVVRDVQQMLKKRGFDPGEIDGWFGQKTKAAVMTYQMAHPHLKNDGIIGPATIAQLRRDMAALKDAAEKSGASAAASGAVAWASGLPVGWIVGGVVILAAVWFAWRYRDVIARRFNTMTGRSVEV
ncbi:MAG: peptidoglycan-binding protein [Martelella sp.]|uniref:glycoside hydrolase family protein n=1 Tax=unclassified Martelella TaxID=2629616 RepID=UPI000C543564|nr:peptidoglycan-binding protein [Martelella sp.]MAU22531.1 peptidoglycan-binding protein [Martelella sp.]|tara:strand:+ start:289 stop:1239 length:951 start_codon:yes stop_codon:yes gene_type:complete